MSLILVFNKTLSWNLLPALLCLLGIKASAQYPSAYAYLDRYNTMAINEMKRTGIPASITLGQALLESGSGTSVLATKANNHFGIKCGSSWQGNTFGRKDDERRLLFFKKKSCFRKYNSPEESYQDHSEFLRRPNGPYQSLFNLASNDYKGWAYGLKQAGYATSDSYAKDLIRIIELYQLYKYDSNSNQGTVVIRPDKPLPENKIPVEPKKTTSTQTASKGFTPLRINQVRAAMITETMNVDEFCTRARLPIKSILKYNPWFSSATYMLVKDDLVYLQTKKKSFWGIKKQHLLAPNETVFGLSQRYGVQENKLRERNGLTAYEEPATGQYLYLRGKRKETAKLKIASKPIAIPIEKPSISPDSEPRPIKDTPIEKPIAKEVPVLIEVSPTQESISTPSGNEETFNFEITPQSTSKPPAQSGQTIEIIKAEPIVQSPITTDVVKPPYPKADPVMYTVGVGDTLYNISKKFGTTVDKLKQLNQLADNNIQIGRILQIR